MTPIVRQPTTKELSDFTPIGYTRDSETIKRNEIVRKIEQRNRVLLLEGKDVKDLSCDRCFSTEHEKLLTDDDVKTNFEKYKNRWKLLKYRKTHYKKGLYREDGICLRFVCETCGIKRNFSYQDFEFKDKELYKQLVEKAEIETATNLDKW